MLSNSPENLLKPGFSADTTKEIIEPQLCFILKVYGDILSLEVWRQSAHIWTNCLGSQAGATARGALQSEGLLWGGSLVKNSRHRCSPLGTSRAASGTKAAELSRALTHGMREGCPQALSIFWLYGKIPHVTTLFLTPLQNLLISLFLAGAFKKDLQQEVESDQLHGVGPCDDVPRLWCQDCERRP